MGNNFVNIFESVVGFYFSWELLRYYLGIGKFSEEKEKRRVVRVKKYGVLIVILSIISFVCSMLILILTLT